MVPLTAYFRWRRICSAACRPTHSRTPPVPTAHFRTAAACALAAVAIAAAPSSAGAVELLNNGSFESIGGQTPESWGGLTYYAGGVALPGWNVEAGSVDLTTSASFWG